nr:hypothetical protein [Streptomyces sp. SID5468]
MAAAGGLLLAAGGTSSAAGWHGGWLLDSDDGGWHGDSYGDLSSEFRCGKRAEFCINGAVDSGNVKDAQNVYINGSPNDSGGPTNINGSVNVDNTIKNTQHSDNVLQATHKGVQRL